MLDDNGRVVNVIALSGPQSLVSASEQNARQWRFQPKSGKTAVIVYQFLIQGLCQLPCASQFLFTRPNFATITIGEAVIDHSPEP